MVAEYELDSLFAKTPDVLSGDEHMRKSKVLAKIRADEAVRICGLGNFLPSYVRHAAHFGFDCIWFDLEHRAMTDREVQSMLGFFHLFDIDCMLRSPTLERVRLYRYLEDGATGLMFPHVTTEQDARWIVEATKFPPMGNRGFDGAGLDSDFALQGGDDYPQQANDETFIVVQIESPQAVANVDAIAAVEGVDGLFVGPGDLSLRLRFGSTMTLKEVDSRVAEAAEKHGKVWGRPAATPEEIGELHDRGAKLIAHGGDFRACMQMLESTQESFDEALQ